MSKTSRPHEETILELLREDPSFAEDYLAASLDGLGEEGGLEALLAALRHIAEAQGMATVAERAGIPRESLYRALSPTGNPTLKTLSAVIHAVGLRLDVHRANAA